MFGRTASFKARMILQKPELKNRLMWHLDRAVRVDIATAFIGEPHSNLLKDLVQYTRRDGTDIRVIVGTMSQQGSSDGDRCRAIRTLARLGVKIREHESNFHPKAYIFRHKDEKYVWVGSNNLTTSAFRHNDELALETSDQRDVGELQAWFEDRWKGATCRKVLSLPPISLVGGGNGGSATLVGLGSDGRMTECQFEAVYIIASNAVLELSSSDDETSNWDARLAMASPLLKRD